MPKLFLRKLFSKISKTNNDPPKSINFKSDKIVADFKNSMKPIPKPKTKQEADSLNRSFRKSDIQRWKTEDFVIGYEIKYSNIPGNECSICKAGEGKYPKDFNWTGWHGGCKCHIVPISAERDVFFESIEAGLAGAVFSFKKYYIKEIPSSFKALVNNNPELYTKCDWYKNNKKYFN
jgi:hypothetical protein